MASVFQITVRRYFQLCIRFAKIYCLWHFLLNSQKMQQVSAFYWKFFIFTHILRVSEC